MAIPSRELPGRSAARTIEGRNGHANTHGDFMTAIDPRDLVRRYVAVWHEPDAELRRKAVHDLWAEDGAHVLQPPQEMRQAPGRDGVSFPLLPAPGDVGIHARVGPAPPQVDAHREDT